MSNHRLHGHGGVPKVSAPKRPWMPLLHQVSQLLQVARFRVMLDTSTPHGYQGRPLLHFSSFHSHDHSRLSL